jgi:type I restriction enzyme S subunit
MNTPDLVGANAYVSAEVSGVYLPDRLWQAIWKEDAQLDPRWLAQILASSAGRTFLKSIASGTSDSMKNISKEAFLSAEVPTPPLPEQRKIAEILTAWDDALEKLDALIAAKERRKKALMQQLLSGKMRGSECSGKWITAKLGDLFTERVEQNRPDLDLLSITADRGIVRRDGLAKRDTSSEDKSKYLRIAPGDIGYNTMRMWQGVSAVSALEGIVSPAYTICTPTKGIDVRFAAHLFKFRHTIHLFHRYSQGLVDDTLNLKFPVFAAIEVFIPADIEAQRRIAAILDTCDDELRLRRAQRAALDQQKRGLMQKLLTGQLRVHA